MTEGPFFYVHAHMAYRVLNSGQISSVTDPTGVVTRLSYDARGNLTGVLNAVGDMLTVEHDAQDRPVSVVSPSGGTMRVEYDVASRPVRVIDPAGNVTVYTYTPAGKVASITDAVGGVRRFEYNAAGELVAQVAPDGARTVREINELGYTVAETDPLGHVTKFVHDGMGRVTEKIDPAGNVWASRYNAADTMVEHTDPTGVLTRVSRDSAAGKITHQDGVGNTATVGFDALGRVMSSIDPSGAVTSWAHQFLTNITTASSGEGDREPAHRQGASEPVRVQDPTENLVRVPGAHALRTCTDAAGQVSGEVCDAAGRVLRQVSASGAVTEYSYDACGRVASVTDADGVMTEYRYDADSRLVAKTRAGVVVESFVYDLCGRVLERRAGTKLVGRYAYDAAGRVVRCVDAAWGTRSFSYDACGRVVKAVSGVGGTCFFDYDGAGRLLARRVATSEGFATTSYAYDAVGNVVSVTDPFGAVTKYAYDGAHRCTEVMNPDGSRVSYAYDGAGEVASMHVAKPGERLGRLACAWVRDRAGRCLTVKDYLAGENLARLGAQWSAAATVATATTTVGSANASATTAAGRSSIGFSDGVESEADVHVQMTYVSDALGRLVRVDSAPKLGDEVSDTAFFAAGNRVSAAENASAAEVFASTGAWSLAYSYDADGNVVQRTTPYGSTVYGYSPGGRIRSTQQIPAGVGVEDSSSVGDKPGVAEFAYDALGYLERVQVGECVSSWVRDTSGAVMGYTEEVLGGANEPGGSSSGVVQGVRVRRNPAGKITRVEDTVKGSWCEYAYDASGRLIRAVSSDDVSVVWVYDPVGLLMREETHQEGALVRVRAFSYEGERVQTVRLYEALEDGVSSAAPVAGVVEDLAGLDASSLVCTGSIQYSYDVRGFRTEATDHTGSAVRWGWDALGSLELVERINHTPESLLGSHVAAGGEDSLTGNSAVCFAASSVRNMPVAVGSQQDGQGAVVSPLVWDTTVPDAASLVGVGVTETVSAGSVFGGRDSILTGTGAGAYGFGTDIFGAASPVTWGSNTTAAAGNGLPGLPADVGLTAQGALATVGGELMGARLYDPVTAGFLSPDPVEPVAGSGYMGASYLFASGDPVNLHDPTGLRPISIEWMRLYIDHVNSKEVEEQYQQEGWENFMQHLKNFFSFSWDDFIDSLAEAITHPLEHLDQIGAMLLFVGALAGIAFFPPTSLIAIISGGVLSGMAFSAILQRWETGEVDANQLSLDGLISGATSGGIWIIYARRLQRLSAMGAPLRLEGTGMNEVMPKAAAKEPWYTWGFSKPKVSSIEEDITRLYRGGTESSRATERLREIRYPKVEIEVKPVAGGSRSATEVPQVAVSRVDVPQVAPVEGSGASRGAPQVPVKPVEAPQVGEVPPASGAGSGAAGMQAVKPGGVADDAVAARGSAGVREPGVQLRPVEAPKVEGLDTAQVQRVTRDEHLVPVAHGQAVPELAERGVPNGGGTYGRGFYNAPRADDYLKSRINWEGLKGKRVKYPDSPNIQYVDNLKKLNQEVRNYRTAQAQIKAENAEIKEYNKAVRKQAKLDGVEVGSPGYELKELKPMPPEPKLRIFRDDFIDSKGEKMVTDYTSGMYGTDPGVNKYLVLRPSEYDGEIPQEAFDMAKEVWTKGGNLHPDARFQGFKNELEYRLNIGTSEEVKHTYVPLPTRMTNVPKKGDPQEFMDLKYYEATIKVPGEVTAEKFGTHRLVIANNGTMYYTPDHYRTFILIKE